MLLRLLCDVCYVFGPVLSYVPQYRHIQRSRNSEGFSLLVSLILIAAALLRIHFWWGKQFDFPLMLQSVAMLVGQVVLLRVCTMFPCEAQKGHSLLDGKVNHFWYWEDFPSYLFTIAFASIILTQVTHLMEGRTAFFEVLGYLSLLMEAILALPQVCENANRGSVDGLSGMLVAGWVLGHAAKIVYCALTDSPVQFLVCGAVQLSTDLIIVAQFWLYIEKPFPSSRRSAPAALDEQELTTVEVLAPASPLSVLTTPVTDRKASLPGRTSFPQEGSPVVETSGCRQLTPKCEDPSRPPGSGFPSE